MHVLFDGLHRSSCALVWSYWSHSIYSIQSLTHACDVDTAVAAGNRGNLPSKMPLPHALGEGPQAAPYAQKKRKRTAGNKGQHCSGKDACRFQYKTVAP